MWSEHRFISFDRTPVFFRRLRVAGRPKGTLLVIHGMGEHSGRYKEFAEYLAQAGFSSCLPDIRGFGQSGGKRGCLRHFSDYFRDLNGVYRLLLAWEDARPPFFFGHSYGGLIAAGYLASQSAPACRGLVLSSPNFGISIPVPAWRHLLALVSSRLFPDFTQPNRVDRSTLTHDKSYLMRYADDKLIHDRISARLYTELVSRIRQAEHTAARFTAPCLFLQAGDDRVVSREANERFFWNLASPDKQYKVYEGLYHEVLNETSRHAIYQEIADWLSKRTE